MISRNYLVDSYLGQRKSVSEIAALYGCSENKVTYWLQKYNIKKRSVSEAIYIKSNPLGDPFSFTRPISANNWFLYGLGLGLFWGEGNKVNKNSVRLGNTDVHLIKFFLKFLREIYNVDEKKLRFGLQLFTDISPSKARRYWVQELGVSEENFQKVVITKSVRRGTYRKKSEYGVLTVYFSNTKLRDTIISAITELRIGRSPS
jgi:hypothetical protein